MFKRTSLWLSTTIFTLAILGIIISTTSLTLLRPGNIKTWLQKSGAYSSLPTALLSEAAKKQESSDSDDGIAFSDPGIQMAAKAALSAEFLETSGNQIVDGTFAWLDGQAAKPTFVINVASAKQTFIDKLGEYLEKRYAALPACAPGTAPTTTDPFKIDCRPTPEIDINSIVAEQKTKLAENKDFLPKTELSADNVLNDQTQGEKNTFEEWSQLPKSYRMMKLLPLALGVVALLVGLAVVLLSETKKAGVHKLGWRLAILGGLSLLVTGLGILGLTKVRGLATSQGNDAAVTIYKDILGRGLDAVRQDLIITGAIISGVLLILGITLLLLTRKLKDKETAKPTEPKAKPPVAPKPTKVEPAKPVSKPAAPAPTAPLPSKPRPKPKRQLIQ